MVKMNKENLHKMYTSITFFLISVLNELKLLHSFKAPTKCIMFVFYSILILFELFH